jgi:6-phosphogluconate dehydrogenase
MGANSDAKQADIGLIGLGVMGENLALNIERNGYTIAVFNRHTDKVDAFVADRGKGKNVIGTKDEKTFVESLKRPRKIILLVKAGDAVDSTIAKIKPYLEKGDIIIDGGNSHFQDTRKREKALAADGLYFIGSGVSGGEEGALWGPSLMPGGDKGAYEQIQEIWEKIAAKVANDPCVTYLGPDGAGHYVKMVHNGIEYGEMQLIAESYDLMRRGLGLPVSEIAEIFDRWNQGKLNSFLIEITAGILTVVDKDTNKPLVDLIVDEAGQKGTGKWTTEIAAELGVPVPTIEAAWAARLLSALKPQRMDAARVLTGPQANKLTVDKNQFIQQLEDALYAARICSYAQGMALIVAGSNEYNWNIDLVACARIWRGGCIIRAKLLEEIMQAYLRKKDIVNLLLDPKLGAATVSAQASWRTVVTQAIQIGIPIPAYSASLAYFDSYRTPTLPQNLTQAQRDYFGAHTYLRIDHADQGLIHTDWPSLIKVKAGTPKS